MTVKIENGKPVKVSADYAEAAKRYLTAAAAARYCAGDMSATDEAGHEAIAYEASKVAAERCDAWEKAQAAVAPAA